MAAGLFQSQLCSANALQLLELVGYRNQLPVCSCASIPGMLQRVGMAQAFNDPELFLDEPMSGLDPLSTKCGRLFSASKPRQDNFSIATSSQRWSKFAIALPSSLKAS